MMDIELIDYLRSKDYIDKNKVAELFDTNEKVVRDTIAVLRKNTQEGNYFLPARIPGNPGVYKRLQIATYEEQVAFLNENMRRLKSTYFDTLLPLKEHVDDKRKQLMYGFADLFMDWEELDNDSDLL